MNDNNNDRTILPLNEEQRTAMYKDINDNIQTLRRSLIRLADYAEMIREPNDDQLRELQRNAIACVHAFTAATQQLTRRRTRRD